MPGLRGPVYTGNVRTAIKQNRPDMSRPERRLTIPFDDNRVVAELFGEHDANLAALEDKLGLEAVAHGNVVTLAGSESAVLAGRAVLEELYARAAKGLTITPADVTGAARLLVDGKRRDSAHGNGNVAKIADAKDQPRDQVRTRRRHINARTQKQAEYIEALQTSALVFSSGPAGTGKTYLAVAFAAAMWERGEIDRIILSRPAVEAGERLGFLPGDMKDKVDPYLRPLYDALYDVLPPDKVERGIEMGEIEIAPLAFMRGRTLANAFVILDEAQNTTSMQMKMFLTRIGEGSRMVVTGDPTQIDLPKGQVSGLGEAVGLLRGVEEVAVVEFSQADVVRRALVGRIVKAYEQKG